MQTQVPTRMQLRVRSRGADVPSKGYPDVWTVVAKPSPTVDRNTPDGPSQTRPLTGSGDTAFRSEIITAGIREVVRQLPGTAQHPRLVGRHVRTLFNMTERGERWESRESLKLWG